MLALRIVAALLVHERALDVGERAFDAPNEGLHGGVFGARVDKDTRGRRRGGRGCGDGK